MLDQDLKDQLRTVFAPLEKLISLVYVPTDHEDQQQLLDLLNSLTEVSGRILVKAAELTSKAADSSASAPTPPQFHIEVNGKPNGVRFNGIPNGHEFTSLIVAILNSDLKGKMPDALLTRRIQNLKGPIRLKTFISLTCENCPDVVQALNQMAILHSDFQHQMTDGLYYQEDITRLNIQGVPSIIVNDKLIHSGRITFLDLLTKLEENFGKQNENQTSEKVDLGQFDVAVIGAGPAGASAAIYSVRKGLKTVVIADRLGGQVQDTKGIENLISVPYIEGPQLAAQLNQHMAHYPIQIFENRRVERIAAAQQTEKSNHSHKIHLQGGEELTTKSIIVATGAKWRELNIPGERDYIGRGVAFCPHCDGPYYKGKKVAVIGGGNSGVEAAIDLAGIVHSVVLIEYGDQLKADSVLVNKLKSLSNVEIIMNAKTKSIQGDGQKVNSLIYEDRTRTTDKTVTVDGVFVQIGLVPNSQFLKETVELNKFGEIIVDEKCRTNVKGIYAAGDVTTVPFKQIIIAMGEGSKAALAAFEDSMKN